MQRVPRRLGVEELQKPYFAKCENQGDGKCLIHGEHPKSCQEFRCLWKLGVLGGSEERPDRLHYVIIPVLHEIDGKKTLYIDVLETKPMLPTPDEQHLDNLNRSINNLATAFPSITAVRYYKYGNKVGVPWEIAANYPQGTHNIGNRFVIDKDMPELLWHVNPEEPK